MNVWEENVHKIKVRTAEETERSIPSQAICIASQVVNVVVIYLF